MFEHEITNWSKKRRFHWPGVAIAVIISLLFVISPASIRASPTPGPLSCVVTDTVTSSVTYHATNATISWTVQVKSTIYLYWGNTTNYGYTAVNGTVYGSGTNTTFLDFLEPGTNYYYYVEAMFDPPHPYYCPGAYSGGWGTPADHMTTISGQVVDVNGTSAPSIEIWIRCRISPPWNDYPMTNATGYYLDTSIGNKLSCDSPLYGGYEITAFAAPLGGPNYQNFLGHWNETIVVWAPQQVNFGLPTTTETWLPMAAAFVNNNGRALQGGTYFLNSTYSKWWSGYQYSSSVQFKESGNFTYPVNQNQVILGLYQTDGMLVMNATTNRTPYVSAIQYWGPQQKSSDNPNYAKDPDTLANFNPTNCAGGYKVNRPAGTWWNGTAKVSGSVVQQVKAGVYLTWGVGLGIGVDFGLTGIGIGVGLDISFILVDYSESITLSQTATWGWNVQYTAGGQYYSVCFDTSGPGNTEVMHIYESSS